MGTRGAGMDKGAIAIDVSGSSASPALHKLGQIVKIDNIIFHGGTTSIPAVRFREGRTCSWS